MRDSRVARVRNCVIGCLILAVMLAPLYWIAVTSLESDSEIFAIPVSLWPSSFHWSTYVTVIGDQWRNIGSSFIVAGGTVAVTLLIAAPTGYALARYRVRFFYLATISLLVVQMIPSIVMASVLFVLLNKIGLVDNLFGLILANSTAAVPFGILLMRVFMAGVPRELIEAALIDGAGEWQAFRRIALPLSRTGQVTVSLFAFLFAWGNFIYALVLMQTPSRTPVTLTIYQYLSVHHAEWSKVMALGMLASIPVGAILVGGQRYIRGGILSGAMKG